MAPDLFAVASSAAWSQSVGKYSFGGSEFRVCGTPSAAAIFRHAFRIIPVLIAVLMAKQSWTTV